MRRETPSRAALGALKGSCGHLCPPRTPSTKARSRPCLRAEPRPCVRDLAIASQAPRFTGVEDGCWVHDSYSTDGKMPPSQHPSPLEAQPLQREDTEDPQAELGKAKDAGRTHTGPGRESLAEARRVDSWVSGSVRSHFIDKRIFRNFVSCYECNLLLIFPSDAEVKTSVAFKLLRTLDCCLLRETWNRDWASWSLSLGDILP